MPKRKVSINVDDGVLKDAFAVVAYPIIFIGLYIWLSFSLYDPGFIINQQLRFIPEDIRQTLVGGDSSSGILEAAEITTSDVTADIDDQTTRRKQLITVHTGTVALSVVLTLKDENICILSTNTIEDGCCTRPRYVIERSSGFEVL